MDFSGKVVLITGGSRGIGRAAVSAFAAAGASVAFTFAENEEAAKNLLIQLPGSSHLAFRADIASEKESERLVHDILTRYGRIDILVNNAGIYAEHRLDTADFDAWKSAWDRTMAVNLTGAAHLTFFVAKQMIKQGGGKIINISSRGAFRGEPDFPAYGASKAGLNSFSQSLARHLGPHNIFVYAIAPGFVETDMGEPFLHGPAGEAIRSQSPLNRAAAPEEVVHAILMAAAPGSEYMTGAIIDVNGASYLRS
jgi:3-oxoacyl-[acyl-carrier protein] reductase